MSARIFQRPIWKAPFEPVFAFGSDTISWVHAPASLSRQLFVEDREAPFRMFDPHALPNGAKGASTSFSLRGFPGEPFVDRR